MISKNKKVMVLNYGRQIIIDVARLSIFTDRLSYQSNHSHNNRNILKTMLLFLIATIDFLNPNIKMTVLRKILPFNYLNYE